MNTEHTPRTSNDEIDLRELMAAIAKGKWIILAISTLFTVLAVFYALSLPNIYKSEVTLAPASDSGGLNIPGQLGGLAALAGVNIGVKGGDKTALALEILKSREFLGRFIEENDLYLPIMAAKGWDRVSNKLLIDSEIYNEETKQWVREVKEPFKPKPSVLETIEEFEKRISVIHDEVNGIVKLSLDDFSPYAAKQLVDKLVIALNEDMRRRDLSEAEKSISYLNEKIRQTSIADVRSMLFSLIEDQTKTVMLANVRNEYILKTIDSAVVSEKKSKPNRLMIVILTMILTMIISAFIVVAVHFGKLRAKDL